MDHDIQKLIQKLKAVSLSRFEKNALRSSLLLKIRGGELKEQRKNTIFSSWILFAQMSRLRVAVASFLVVALSGSTVVFAAEQSLPGDILFPVKTNVNENIGRVVNSASLSSKAEFEANLLEKRLVEAEKLEAKKALNEPVKGIIKEEIIKQAARAESARENFSRGSSPKLALEEVPAISQEIKQETKNGNLPEVDNKNKKVKTDIVKEKVQKNSSKSAWSERKRATPEENKKAADVANTGIKAAQEETPVLMEEAKGVRDDKLEENDKSDNNSGKNERKQKEREKIEEIRQKHQDIIEKLEISTKERRKSEDAERNDKNDKGKDEEDRD